MFRSKTGANSRAVLLASIGLLIAIVVATGLNLWLVAEIRKEQQAVAEIMRGGIREDIERLGTLPVEMRWQLIFTLLVLGVLVVSAVMLVFVVRAYMNSQRSLRDTLTLADDILASLDVGLITTDMQGLVTSINPQGCRLLRVETAGSAAMIGTPLSALDSPGVALASICAEVLSTGCAVHDRLLTMQVDGREHRLRADCHGLRKADWQRRGAVLHLRDVTQQLWLEQRMRRMERFMGLGTLAAGLHHEIKNPLSALSLHVQLMEESLPRHVDSRLVEHVNVVKTEVTRIVGVLESFRDYASVAQLNVAPIDLAEIVRRSVDLIRPRARQQGVEVAFHGGARPLPALVADAVRLEQVFLNLILNALEEMPEGGQLGILTREDGRQVIVSISDTGGGVPEEARPHLFDPYYTTKSSGSGMGLAFCEKIVREHGGHLTFDTGSSGTVFHVHLSLDREEGTSLEECDE